MGNISRTYNNGAGQTLKILDEINQKDNLGKGISTVYEYDDNGQQIKETYADGSYVQSEYEASTGYLLKKSKFNKNGKCESYTTYSYDTEGNVQSAIDYKNVNHTDTHIMNMINLEETLLFLKLMQAALLQKM